MKIIRKVRKYLGVLIIAIIATTCLGVDSVEAIGVLEPRSGQDSHASGESVADDYQPAEIKDMVQSEFGKNHPMVAVARCESSFRQFNESGDVLRNPESDAIGIFQILEGLHEEPAEKLGIDIFTAKGNIAYARKLYNSFGLAPWSPSSLCWDDGSIAATNPAGVTVQGEQSTRVPVQVRSDGELKPLFGDNEDEEGQEVQNEQSVEPVDNPLITKKLVSGVRDPQVKTLQRLLNDIGYQLSASGPGSPGQETSFFGAKTRAAVKDFQCDNNIVCEGGRYTTGYGLVGKETRQALNQAAEDRNNGVYRIGDMRVRTDDSDKHQTSTQQIKQNQELSSNSSEIQNESLAAELARAQALVSRLAAKIRNK